MHGIIREDIALTLTLSMLIVFSSFNRSLHSLDRSLHSLELVTCAYIDDDGF